MLLKVIDRLDCEDPTDNYINEAVKDLNGNYAGELTLIIET